MENMCILLQESPTFKMPGAMQLYSKYSQEDKMTGTLHNIVQTNAQGVAVNNVFVKHKVVFFYVGCVSELEILI